MGSFSVYDHFYSRREQLLSSLAAVPLLSWPFLPICNSKPGQGGRSSNGVFHFARIHQGDSLPVAMARHQHILFSQLHLRPKKRVLALACGNGATSEQLIRFSDVDVVGIDIDAHLVSSAKTAAEKAGLAGRLTYHHVRDICEALETFPDCSFDAVFAIELGYRTPSPLTLYKHIQRLLKPSGRFALYEWCFTEALNPAYAEHVAAVRNFLRSFPNAAHINSISTVTNVVSTLRAAGLENIAATELALNDRDIPCWWYGQLSIEALLTAGRLRIFSPMVLVTGEKSGERL